MWRRHRCSDYVLFEKYPPHIARYECATCKCLMETPTKTIKTVIMMTNYESHYCGKCAPAYDKVEFGSYYRMMQCNYDGTPWVAPDAKKSK